MRIESLLKQKIGSNPKSVEVFNDMRRASGEARKALQRSGDPEVCDDRSSELPNGGSGVLSEGISEVCPAGVTVGRCPSLEDRDVQNDDVD